MPFEELAQAAFKKKSSLIADQILRMIRTGAYPPGSRLPAERVIAEQMKVGRPSVREAISALHIAGILESRPGDGTYVSGDPGGEAPRVNALAVLEESDSPFEILQMRKTVEIGVVHQAVKRATPDDIRAIQDAWRVKLQKARRGDYQGFIHHGREFHLAIARATGSRSVAGLTERLLNMNYQPLWFSMREEYYREDRSRIEPMIQIHDEMVKAIEARDAARAIAVVEEHYDIQLRQHYDEGSEGPDATP